MCSSSAILVGWPGAFLDLRNKIQDSFKIRSTTDNIVHNRKSLLFRNCVVTAHLVELEDLCLVVCQKFPWGLFLLQRWSLTLESQARMESPSIDVTIESLCTLCASSQMAWSFLVLACDLTMDLTWWRSSESFVALCTHFGWAPCDSLLATRQFLSTKCVTFWLQEWSWKIPCVRPNCCFPEKSCSHVHSAWPSCFDQWDLRSFTPSDNTGQFLAQDGIHSCNEAITGLHLVAHFERNKINLHFFVLKEFNVASQHVDKIIMEVQDLIVKQSKTDMMCFGTGMQRFPQFGENCQQTLLHCRSFSHPLKTSMPPMWQDHCSSWSVAELNCDTCQSDKWQFITAKPTANKGWNQQRKCPKTATKSSASMFHQRNKISFAQMRNLWVSLCSIFLLHVCLLLWPDCPSRWQDWSHGAHALIIVAPRSWEHATSWWNTLHKTASNCSAWSLCAFLRIHIGSGSRTWIMTWPLGFHHGQNCAFASWVKLKVSGGLKRNASTTGLCQAEQQRVIDLWWSTHDKLLGLLLWWERHLLFFEAY